MQHTGFKIGTLGDRRRICSPTDFVRMSRCRILLAGFRFLYGVRRRRRAATRVIARASSTGGGASKNGSGVRTAIGKGRSTRSPPAANSTEIRDEQEAVSFSEDDEAKIHGDRKKNDTNPLYYKLKLLSLYFETSCSAPSSARKRIREIHRTNSRLRTSAEHGPSNRTRFTASRHPHFFC